MVEVDRISNPHDLFFRVTLSNQQAVKDFFEAHLPEDVRRYIPIDSIKRAKDSHISSKLRELRNDLIFTAQIDVTQALYFWSINQAPIGECLYVF